MMMEIHWPMVSVIFGQIFYRQMEPMLAMEVVIAKRGLRPAQPVPSVNLLALGPLVSIPLKTIRVTEKKALII